MMAFVRPPYCGLNPLDSECAYDSSSDTDLIAVRETDVEREPEAKRRRTESGFCHGFTVPRLSDLTVDVVATKIPFKMVEGYYHRRKVNDSTVMEIMKKSFPTNRDVIGLRASLCRSRFGDENFRHESKDCGIVVTNATQTGLSLTGTLVHKYQRRARRGSPKAVVSLLFDRRCITTATCSVHRHHVQWCKHILRLVEHRISKPDSVVYRLPISFTLERLNLTQMKQFFSSLFSSSTKLLSSANKAIDAINTAPAAISSASHGALSSMASVPVTDLTARGNRSDSCLWHFDEKRVRRVMKNYCGDHTFMEGGRSFAFDPFEPVSFSRWCFLLDRNEKRSLARVNTDAYGRLRWEVKEELDCLFSIVEHLLKSGDSTVLQVLDLLTEQWFGMMEKVVRIMRRYLPWNLRRREGDLEAEENPSMYSENQELLLASGRAWFVPDRLATCWRFAVLSPFYSEDVIERLRHRLIEWAIRMRKASTEARRLYDLLIDDVDEYWQDLCAVVTTSNWNGFCHVQALGSPQTRSLFHRMPTLDVGLCTNAGDRDGTDGSDFLRTVSCCVQCLQFYGHGAAATALALQVIISTSSAHVQLPDMVRLPTIYSSSLLAAVRQFQNEIGLHVWGNSDDEDDDNDSKDPIPMTTLLRAIASDENAWKMNCTVEIDLTSSDSESDDYSSQESVEIPLPVHALLECIHGFTGGSNWSGTAPKLDLVIELGKLHLDMVDRIMSLPSRVKKTIFQAVKHNVDYEIGEQQSILKLAFLFRLLLFHVEDSYPSTSLPLVSECLQVLSSDLSDRIGGQGPNEDFFLALTIYSSLFLRSLQVEISLELDRHSRCSAMAESMDICYCAVSDTYFARRRLQQFVSDILHVTSLICPSLSSHIADHFLQGQSLADRLKLLHLPESKPPGDLDDNKLAAAFVAGVLLTRLLQITRQVQEDIGVIQIRTRALRGLVHLAMVIGAETVLEIVTDDDWYCVVSTSEAINHLLLEIDFAKSLRYRRQELCSSVEKLVRDVVINPLYAFSADDLVGQAVYYESVELLGVTPLVIRDVLADAPEACRLNYLLLFRLLDYCVDKSDALKIALKAYEAMWTNVVLQGENVVAANIKRPTRFSTILRGVHCLGAMAMQLDLASTPCGSVNELLLNTYKVLQLVLEMWVDPMISLHIVAEVQMARIREGGEYPPPSSMQCDILKYLEWSDSPPFSALASFSRGNRLATSVLHRCKVAILSAVGEDVHLPYNSIEYLQFKPQRCVLGDDFLCLGTILYVFPDPTVNLEALVSHCAVCLWQDAAKSYYRAYAPINMLTIPSNYYETYYRGLIGDEDLTRCLFAHSNPMH